jgi:hypothetical protein
VSGAIAMTCSKTCSMIKQLNSTFTSKQKQVSTLLKHSQQMPSHGWAI